MGLCNGPGAVFSDEAVEPAAWASFHAGPRIACAFWGAKSWNWQSSCLWQSVSWAAVSLWPGGIARRRPPKAS